MCDEPLIAAVSSVDSNDTWLEHSSFENGPGIEIFDYMLDPTDKRFVPKSELLRVFQLFHAELEKHADFSRRTQANLRQDFVADPDDEIAELRDDSSRDRGTGIALGPYDEASGLAPNSLFLKISRPLSQPRVPPSILENRGRRK